MFPSLPLSSLPPTDHSPLQAHNMRSILKFSRPSRRVLPGLNALKTSLEIVSKAESSVPPLQAVADTALEIIKYAEVHSLHPKGATVTQAEFGFSLCQTAKKNRKEAIELVDFAGKVIKTIVDLPTTDPVPKRYRADVPLFGAVDPGKCSFKILGTKLEVTLHKAGGDGWPVLRSDDRATGGRIQIGRAGRV